MSDLAPNPRQQSWTVSNNAAAYSIPTAAPTTTTDDDASAPLPSTAIGGYATVRVPTLPRAAAVQLLILEDSPDPPTLSPGGIPPSIIPPHAAATAAAATAATPAATPAALSACDDLASFEVLVQRVVDTRERPDESWWQALERWVNG